MTFKYVVGDSCYEKAVEHRYHGEEIFLDNEEHAFAFASHPIGTELLCSVKRLAKDNHNMTVVIESALDYAA